MISGIKSFLLTRAKFFLDANQRIFIRRRSDKAMSPKYLCSPAKRKLSVLIGGGEGRGVTVEGTINRPISTMTFGK